MKGKKSCIKLKESVSALKKCSTCFWEMFDVYYKTMNMFVEKKLRVFCKRFFEKKIVMHSKNWESVFQTMFNVY